MQLLSVGEEEAIVSWIKQLGEWGWPPRVLQLRKMATELLHAKGSKEELGIHWTDRFFARHPELEAKFYGGLDRQRALALDPDILTAWFNLYKENITKYNINQCNIYNMDEKGILMGLLHKTKVIVSILEARKGAIRGRIQPRNQEFVTLIECISRTGRLLSPWITFKGKQHNAEWMQVLQEGYVALSDNGWTDNELGVEWLKQCFDLETRSIDGKPRILIMDGHSSHISTKALEFCIASNIIVLCLPSHSTYITQPLDVGIFRPLAMAYSKGVLEKGEYNP